MEFKEFQNHWNFKHRISSPQFPRSNGLAERYVQEAKNLLTKCMNENSDIQPALLLHRNTPRGNLGSPSQRLMSRRTRTLVPTHGDLLKPKIVSDVTNKLKLLKTEEKQQGDRGKTSTDAFSVGQRVLYRSEHKNWLPAVVIRNGPEPRSYVIKTKYGAEYRRNSWFIKAVLKE
uniref:Integrase catalytic domain-containing protein n=1 Tax=Lygus hesperus TaxID=30085 RepID=A0A0K8TB15_LYGHE